MKMPAMIAAIVHERAPGTGDLKEDARRSSVLRQIAFDRSWEGMGDSTLPSSLTMAGSGVATMVQSCAAATGQYKAGQQAARRG
jgi:hypothetical protein